MQEEHEHTPEQLQAARDALHEAERAAGDQHELLQAYLAEHGPPPSGEVSGAALAEYAQALEARRLMAEGEQQALEPAARTDFPPPHMRSVLDEQGVTRVSVFAGACAVNAAVVNQKRAHALTFGVPNGQVDVYLTEEECRSLWEYLGTHLAQKRIVVTGRMPTPPAGTVRKG